MVVCNSDLLDSSIRSDMDTPRIGNVQTSHSDTDESRDYQQPRPLSGVFPHAYGLDKACKVVKDILHQITLNDSPPINEDLAMPPTSSSTSEKLHRQPADHHQQPLPLNKNISHHNDSTTQASTLDGASVNSSSTYTSGSTDIQQQQQQHSYLNETAAHYMQQYTKRQKKPEQRLGNICLAALCQTTLDSTRSTLLNCEATSDASPVPLETMDSNEENVIPDHDGLTQTSPTKTVRSMLGTSDDMEHTIQALQNSRGYGELEKISEEMSQPLETPEGGAFFAPRSSNDEFRDIQWATEPSDAQESGKDFSQPIKPVKKILSLHDRLQKEKQKALSSAPRLKMFGCEYARFLSETPLGPSRNKRTSRKPFQSKSRSNSTTQHHHGFDLEDADDDIFSGAITDILVTHDNTIAPKGYYRISKALYSPDLKRSGTTEVHYHVKKEPNWDRAAQRPCVTALAVIFPERGEIVPPGFCVVRLYKGTADGRVLPKSSNTNPADLNHGVNNGERVYLCYRRSREGNPITGLQPLLPLKQDSIPEGYTVLERSPRDHIADVNAGGAFPVFLAFRQRLASLEPLRPLPLLLHVYYDTAYNNAQQHIYDDVHLHELYRGAKLEAYYSTGGTTIPSKVGKYHIMDRSTHSLISHSSIKNRLLLIQSARNTKSSDNASLASSLRDSDYPELDLSRTPSGSFQDGESLVENQSQVSFLREASDAGTWETGSERYSTGSTSVAESSRLNSLRYHREATSFFANSDQAMKLCVKAFKNVPVVEFPPRPSGDGESLLEIRTAILTPILTACYTHHGGASMLAVQGLISLLNDTDFFLPDLVHFPECEGSDSRTTLLDLSIQSVCDIATSTSRETSFIHCIDFVKNAVRFSECYLNSRTIGYVLRFYLFVFYFGASVPSSSMRANTVWPSSGDMDGDTRSAVAQEDIPFLFEPEKASSYLPGGAPQSAALGLKHLISLLMNRMVVLSYSERLKFSEDLKNVASMDSCDRPHDEDPVGGLMSDLVTGIVNDATRNMDLANYTQLALHQIHRSGGSELFWYDMMTNCGTGLFGGINGLPAEHKKVHMTLFSLLANMVKISSGKTRRLATTGALVPRDVASKLLSLELLCHLMTSFRQHLEDENLLESSAPSYQEESIQTMVYSLRRLVVPCLIGNTIQGLQDSRIFRRIMFIVTEIWKNPIYRSNMKVEIGVIFEHFSLRLLQLGPQLVLPRCMHTLDKNAPPGIKPPPGFDVFQEALFNQQVDMMFELNRWFANDARSLIELYLNFDTDMSQQKNGQNNWMPGSHWKLCERLCGSICSIAESSSEMIVEQIKQSNMTNEGPLTPTMSSDDDSSPTNATSRSFDFGRRNREKDNAKIEGEIDKAAIRMAARQLQKSAFTAAAQFARCIAIAAATSCGGQISKIVSRDGTGDNLEGCEAPLRQSGDGNDGILSYWRTAIAVDRKKPSSQVMAERLAKVASPRAKLDSTLLDATVTERISMSDETLQEGFTVIRKRGLKKGVQFLIENNVLTDSPRDIATFLRVHHSRLDPTDLGDYLGEGGTTDEDIERWSQIRLYYCRAISFVGLTVEQGLRHFLTNCSFRLPGEAQRIDRVMNTFAMCYWEDNAGDHHRCPFEDQDTVFLLAFATIMLNTDLHKASLPVSSKSRGKKNQLRRKMTKTEFLNNLREVAADDNMTKDYLGEIYDSVEAHPIELYEEPVVPVKEITTNTIDHNDCRDLAKMLKSMIKNVKKSEELLRGLSVHEFQFYTLQDFADYMSSSKQEALADLTHAFLTATWQHFYNLIKATVISATLDPQALVLSLDLLRHVLLACICLDMTQELEAFAKLLAKIKLFAGNAGIVISSTEESYRLQDWFGDLQASLAESDTTAALEQVQDLMDGLVDRLTLDAMARSETTRTVRSIQEGQFLLHDSARIFYKAADLQKKSKLVGRLSTLRFFLFSDLLLYAKKQDDSFLIHEVLSLHQMKVVDWYPNKNHQNQQQMRQFSIHHPHKSFTVVCKDVEERKEWVTALRSRISDAIRRFRLLHDQQQVDYVGVTS